MFGRQRDVSLIRHVNRELLGDIITQQIGYYKYKIEETYTNIYGEAIEKFLIDPVLFNCLVTRNDQVWSGDDFGSNVARNLSFAFLRDDLKDAKIIPEVGDVILYLNNYYEVDSVVENQLFVGKDPDYPYSNGLADFGTDLSFICTGVLVPSDKFGLTKERM